MAHLQYYWVVLIIYLVGFKVVLMPYQRLELFNYFETAYFGSYLEYLAEMVKALVGHAHPILRQQFLVYLFQVILINFKRGFNFNFNLNCLNLLNFLRIVHFRGNLHHYGRTKMTSLMIQRERTCCIDQIHIQSCLQNHRGLNSSFSCTLTPVNKTYTIIMLRI